jgi:hypothetical protein
MKKIIGYLLLLTGIDVVLIIFVQSSKMPSWFFVPKLIVLCSLLGGLGGAVYCLRGVYVNASVKKRWSEEWYPWYFIRPIVSHITGAISFIFLKAGLLLLEAKQASETTDLGFLALAFIAGLNVDKFISKVEDIAQATWGIDKSRLGKESKADAD